MTLDRDRIRDDFDRLAAFDHAGWSHNSHYHPYLLRHLPDRPKTALDVGCGTGVFSRLLATRCEHVTGIDLSGEMIRLARERSVGIQNIHYEQADVLDYLQPSRTFEVIASIATLHHLPPLPPCIIFHWKPSCRACGRPFSLVEYCWFWISIPRKTTLTYSSPG